MNELFCVYDAIGKSVEVGLVWFDLCFCFQ